MYLRKMIRPVSLILGFILILGSITLLIILTERGKILNLHQVSSAAVKSSSNQLNGKQKQPIEVYLTTEGSIIKGADMLLTAKAKPLIFAETLIVELYFITPLGKELIASQTFQSISKLDSVQISASVTLPYNDNASILATARIQKSDGNILVASDIIKLDLVLGHILIEKQMKIQDAQTPSILRSVRSDTVSKSQKKTENIEASAGFWVSGKFQYNDNPVTDGGYGTTVTKPVRRAKVEIRDKEAIGSELLGTVLTYESGNFQFFVPNNDDGLFQYGRDIFVQLIAMSSGGNVQSNSIGGQWFMESLTYDDWPGGDLYLGYLHPADAEGNAVFNILENLTFAYDYVSGISTSPTKVTVMWSDGNTDGTHYHSLSNQIHLLGTSNDPDQFDDDVILHEYGHFLAEKYSYSKNPGVQHSWYDHISEELAWSEGWATFFSGGSRNSNYCRDYTTGGVSRYNLESPGTSGPDNEGAVAAILWDIFDSNADGADNLAYGIPRIWSIFDDGSNNRFFNSSKLCVVKDFWDGWFYLNYGSAQQLWAIFNQYGVNYDFTAPSNPTSLSSSSHSISSWSTSRIIAMSWSGASDDLSGLSGYSWDFTSSSNTIPDQIVDGTGLSATSPVLGDGTSWYFHIRTKDIAGNWISSAVHRGPYYIDATPPSGTVTISNGVSTTCINVVPLLISANDNLSGVTQMQFSNDGSTWSAWETYSTYKNWNLLLYGGNSSAGNKVVYARFKDIAGNISTITNDNIQYEIVPSPIVNLTQPTCSVSTGAITITTPTGTGMTYSLDGSTYSNTTGIFTLVTPGSYIVTAKSSAGCISITGTNATINSLPTTPPSPIVILTQPTCSVSMGTITITSPTGSGMTYSINGSTYTNTTGVFNSVASGTYTVTARNSAGCTSSGTNVTINSQPSTPSTPVATLTQPSCSISTGTITITSPTGSGMTYSINGSTYTNTSGVFNSVATGTYTLTARSSAGCTSSGAIVTINDQPSTPSAPVATLVQPTCSVSTGTISITSPTGSGMTYSINGSTYSNTTGIFNSVSPGTYTVTARSSAGCTSTGSIVTINGQPSTPSAPIVSLTQPTCSVSTGTITITSPTGSGMTYSINGSTYTNTTGIFNSVSAGTYTVTARGSAGCTSTGSIVTINGQPSTPSAPNTTLIQPTCSVSTGTITITSPTGSGMTYSINSSTYTNTTGVFNSVASGTYTITARNSAGCTSPGTIVTVNGQPSTPSAPIATLVQPTCSVSTGTITITSPSSSGMTYSINGSTYTNTTGVFNSVATGTYTITARSSAGCTSMGTIVTINDQPSPPSAPIASLTQPTCSVSTGTITITSPTGSGMTYSINGLTYTNTSGVFNSVATGTYTLTARSSAGCTSSGAIVTINDQPSTPTAPIATLIQPTCSVSAGIITITSPTGSGMTYSINGSTYTNTTGIFNSVAAGTYTVTARSSAGCTSTGSIVTINGQPSTPSAPIVSLTQPTCSVSTGTITITSPTGSGMTYSINGSTYSNTTGIFTSVTTGTYTVTARSSAGCTSTGTIVTINSQPATPSVTNQSTSILSGGTFTVTPGGVPVGTTYTWAVPTYTGGVTGGTSQTNPQANISGILTVPSGTGTAIYTVTPTTGSCVGVPFTVTVTVTSSCVPVSMGIQPSDNSMCATTGNASFTIVANGTAPFTYQWQYYNGSAWVNVSNNTPAGASYTNANLPTMSVTGITSSGGHQYRCYITNCVSSNTTSNSATLSVIAAPLVPILGTITQPSCNLATGSIVLNGLPAAGIWTINPGGITGSGTSTTISGLTAGTYNFIVTNASGCNSAATPNVVINGQPSTPAAPIVTLTQPTCSVSTGTITITSPTGSGMTYSINGSTYTNTTGIFTSVISGTYTVTARSSAGCTSAGTIVTINSQPTTPSVTNQSTSILSGGTFTVTPGGFPVGTTYTWTVPTYTGGVTGGSAQAIPQTSISGILTVPSGTGTAIYTVTPTAGSCVGVSFTITVTVTSSCVPVSMGIQPSDNSMCATTGNASFTIVANGTAPFTYQWQYYNGSIWVNVSYNTPAGASYTNANLPTMSVTGITSSGSHQYRCYITNCVSSNTNSNSATLSVIAALIVPILGTITQPSCNLATGSIVLNGLPAAGIWTINPGGITGSGTSTTISGLTAGTYNFAVTNASGCNSAATPNVVINVFSGSPAIPTLGAIIQPTCSVAIGSVVLNNLPPTGSWTINPGSIIGTGTAKTISGLQTGAYAFTVTNSNGCTSLASAEAIINSQPVTPSVGNQTTAVLTGNTFTVAPISVPPGTTYTWTTPAYTGGVTGGSAQTTSQPNISGTLTIPSGTGTAIYTVTPISGSCVGTTFTLTVTVSFSCIPVSIGTQPADNNICATSGNASFTVGANGTAPFTYQWQHNSGGIWSKVSNNIPAGALYTDESMSTMSVSGITSSGSYQYRCNISNCATVGALSNVATLTINTIPTAPSVGTIVQPTFAVPTGSVVLNGLPSMGTWTINPGSYTGTGPSKTITGLASGMYVFTVSSLYGCTSPPSVNVVINSPLSTLNISDANGSLLHQNDTLIVPSDAGIFRLKVESTDNWTVSENTLWFKAMHESNTSLKVTYLENISVIDKISTLKVKSMNNEISLNVLHKARISALRSSMLKFNNVKMFPNPAVSTIYLDMGNEKFDKVIISITNIQGNLLKTKEYKNLSGNQILEVSVSEFPTGQYWIQVGDEIYRKVFQLVKF